MNSTIFGLNSRTLTVKSCNLNLVIIVNNVSPKINLHQQLSYPPPHSKIVNNASSPCGRGGTIHPQNFFGGGDTEGKKSIFKFIFCWNSILNYVHYFQIFLNKNILIGV